MCEILINASIAYAEEIRREYKCCCLAFDYYNILRSQYAAHEMIFTVVEIKTQKIYLSDFFNSASNDDWKQLYSSSISSFSKKKLRDRMQHEYIIFLR